NSKARAAAAFGSSGDSGVGRHRKHSRRRVDAGVVCPIQPFACKRPIRLGWATSARLHRVCRQDHAGRLSTSSYAQRQGLSCPEGIVVTVLLARSATRKGGAAKQKRWAIM